MLRKINAVNVCGTIAFFSMLSIAGFVDGGNYAAAVVSLCAFAGFAYLAVREDGQGNRPR